jgi:hypothetical protein
VRHDAIVKAGVPWWFALGCAWCFGNGALWAETNSSAVRLTGIVSIGQYKRAYLLHEERGHAPEYLSLREGEKVGGIEVRTVDAEQGQVHVVQNGKDAWLSFASQETSERRARQAEKEFVDEHTRAHEELQRRERERLAREAAASARNL